MTPALPGMMIIGRSVIPAVHCPVHGVPGRRRSVVREEDAVAFVLYAHQLLAGNGHKPRITPANERRLVRLGALMLAEFGVGAAESTEDSDG